MVVISVVLSLLLVIGGARAQNTNIKQAPEPSPLVANASPLPSPTMEAAAMAEDSDAKLVSPIAAGSLSANDDTLASPPAPELVNSGNWGSMYSVQCEAE